MHNANFQQFMTHLFKNYYTRYSYTPLSGDGRIMEMLRTTKSIGTTYVMTHLTGKENVVIKLLW